MLGPVMTVVLGGLLGFVVWAVMGPVYDILGRVKSATPPPAGGVITYTYPDGNTNYPTMNEIQVKESNVGSHITRSFIDVWGRTKAVIPAINPSITYTYDYYDRLTQASRGGATTTLTYDLGGRKKQMIDADMGTWNYTYDALGNLKTQTDARGCATTLTYDMGNRLTNKSYSGSGCTTSAITYGYDAGTYGKGYRTSMSDGSGSTAIPRIAGRYSEALRKKRSR